MYVITCIIFLFYLITPLYCIVFVNLYHHAPHAHYYMYNFSFYLITPLYCIIFVNLYAHVPSVHYCIYVCMLYFSSVNHLNPYADHYPS